MSEVNHLYNTLHSSPSLLFFCLPLLAIAGYLLCASISKALWEGEAAANELNCFVLSAEISYNVFTNLFKEIRHG